MLLGFGSGNDFHKGVSLEACTANQTTVDILLSEEAGCVGALHGATVLDAHAFGNGFTVDFLDNGADVGLSFFSLFVGSPLVLYF